MSKSLYWDKMLILHDKNSNKDENDLVISKEEPNFFAPMGPFTIHSVYEEKSDKIFNELSTFYSKNNVLSNGNMTQVSEHDLRRYYNVSVTEILCCRSKLSKKIIGSILSILFPIKLNIDNISIYRRDKSSRTKYLVENNPDVVLFAATTFLNASKKYRGKGLGMVLIQKSLQVAYEIGVICAYFLNTVPRCSNAVEIKCWVFPLNIKKHEQYRLGYMRKYRNYYLNLKSDGFEVQKIDNGNYKPSYYEYINLIKDKKFSLYPDLEYWDRWINNFDTYTVIINGKIQGIFCCIKYTIYAVSCGKYLDYGNRLICVGKQPETAEAMLLECQKSGIDILLLQEVGDLDEDLLHYIHAQKTKTSDYLNFYNTKIKLEAKDLYAPMI